MTKKIRLELRKEAVEIDDKPVKDTDLSKMLANILKTNRQGDAIQFLNWALELYRTGSLEVTESDLGLIKKAVETCQDFAIIRAQLLQEISSQWIEQTRPKGEPAQVIEKD